jgi:hypothetical protein
MPQLGAQPIAAQVAPAARGGVEEGVSDQDFFASITQRVPSQRRAGYARPARRKAGKPNMAVLWLAGIGGGFLLLLVGCLFLSALGGGGRGFAASKQDFYQKALDITKRTTVHRLNAGKPVTTGELKSILGKPDSMINNGGEGTWVYRFRDGAIVIRVRMNDARGGDRDLNGDDTFVFFDRSDVAMH